MRNPILDPEPRRHGDDDFSLTDVQLANRNCGIHLETLKHDVTPLGMHYLLSHFDIPFVADASEWTLSVGGMVDTPLNLDMDALGQFPECRQQVTLECAGNGRALLKPRWQSMPWLCEAVGTAEWAGTSLSHVLERAGLSADATTVVFSGADAGVDDGHLHCFERSLSVEEALRQEVMLAWQINGQVLPPQHGFPLRLVVPGWYGMASVKWLRSIQVTDQPFEGFQQVKTYKFRQDRADPGQFISKMRVRSLMIPPGLPDWFSRKRLLASGPTVLEGRAWSGGGVPISKVEFWAEAVPEDEGVGSQCPAAANWQQAELAEPGEQFAWQGWRIVWQAEPGHFRLRCRATDANGAVQPLDPPWDQAGFGNNAVQNVEIWVEKTLPEVDQIAQD